MVFFAVVAVIAIVVVIVVCLSKLSKAEKNKQNEALRNKFLNHPLAKELAREAGINILSKIKEGHGYQTSENNFYFEVHCFGENKGTYSGISGPAYCDFYKHNLRRLSRDEVSAFMWAVMTQARQYVYDHLKLDPSGTHYTLSEVRVGPSCSYDVACSFTYTAPNGKYQAPKDW